MTDAASGPQGDIQRLRERGIVMEELDDAAIIWADDSFFHVDEESGVVGPFSDFPELLRAVGEVVVQARDGAIIEWRPDVVWAVAPDGAVWGPAWSAGELARDFGRRVFWHDREVASPGGGGGAFFVYEFLGIYFPGENLTDQDFAPCDSLREAIVDDTIAFAVEAGSTVESSEWSTDELLKLLSLYDDEGGNVVVPVNGEQVRFTNAGPPERTGSSEPQTPVGDRGGRRPKPGRTASLEMEMHDGFPLVRIGAGRWILGTGSAWSIGRTPHVEILERRIKLAPEMFGWGADEFTAYVGTPVDGLLGVDALNRFDWRWDLAAGVATAVRGALEGVGRGMEIDLPMGVPKVKAGVGDRLHALIFDTGSPVGYLVDDTLSQNPEAGVVEDSFPLFGSLVSETYWVPVDLGGQALRLRTAPLPPMLAMTCGRGGVRGFLGSALLDVGPVTYAPRRHRLWVDSSD